MGAEKTNCQLCQHFVDETDCSECVMYNKWTPMDTPTVNAQGGKQSLNEYLWTDFHPNAMLRVAKLSYKGCQKYGEGNWKKVTVLEHIGHALSHLFLYLAGNTSEDHLSHACWRILACMGVEELEKDAR